MFTREQSSRLRQEFWTAFGKYMGPVPSSEGLKTNWVNYHTGVRDVYFRMETNKTSATISISLEHTDLTDQQINFEKFEQFKTMLHKTLGERWKWKLHVHTDGRVISRIYKELPDASIFNQDQWPDLISFFKPRIIALDGFWENAKYSFQH